MRVEATSASRSQAERSAGLSARLARHGIALRADVLRDRRRSLVAPPHPVAQVADAMASLHQVLDELAQAVAPGLRPAR